MINIFFVPGMFGSTLEYMLRNFTNNFTPVTGEILLDGSVHSFEKQFHWHHEGIEKLFSTFNDSIEIANILYPEETHSINWIIENWPDDLTKSKNIMVVAENLRNAELNLLFQYYKIAYGVKLKFGLNIFFCINNLDKWDEKIKNWSDARLWQLRESYSLFYPRMIEESWTLNDTDIPNLITVKNYDILYNLKETFLKIVNFCELTLRDENLDTFITEWVSKQNYIINEFNLLDKIVQSTLNKEYFDWSNDRLCLISEAIIQQRLRQHGYNIKCCNLNKFPTNSKELENLLEKL